VHVMSSASKDSMGGFVVASTAHDQ
jgi:hypothetical protein